MDYEAQAFGLATIGVDVSTVGIAGLTLGGGFGWLVRNYGLACDNLLSVDIVTAEGRFLTASAPENTDLFWGVRGGGGNFGIVTLFEYQLHPVGQLLAGMVLYPLTKATDVLKLGREYTSTAPDELTAWAILLIALDGAHTVAIFVCYNGPSAAAQRAVQPLREFGPPLEDHIGPMSYREVQTLFDAADPSGRQNYWKSSFLGDLSDDATDSMVARFATVPSPQSMVLIEHLGGAVSRVGKDEPRSTTEMRSTVSSFYRCGPAPQNPSRTSNGRTSSGRRCNHFRPAGCTSTTWARRVKTVSRLHTDGTTNA